MKMKTMLLKVALLAALSTALSTSTFAYTQAQYDTAKQVLKGTPAAELPAKASAHVGKAAKKDRKNVAVATARAAIEQNRAAARLVVAAIARIAPESATVVAATASSIVPAERAFIATAANVPIGTVTAAEAIATRPSRVAPPTEGQIGQNDNPINNQNRVNSDGDNDGNDQEPNDDVPQNQFPNPGTNPPKPPPNPPAPAPNNYQRHK
jgi:hypothetical protein